MKNQRDPMARLVASERKREAKRKIRDEQRVPEVRGVARAPGMTL